MRRDVFLLLFGKKDTLFVSRKLNYSNKIKSLQLKEAKSLSMRSLGLPDLLINPATREVFGIVYSNFNANFELQDKINQLNSDYVRLLSDNDANKAYRYSEYPSKNRLEIFWGDVTNCILEPASLMGDVWFEDKVGDIKAFALELYQFWNDKYYSYPAKFNIALASPESSVK